MGGGWLTEDEEAWTCLQSHSAPYREETVGFEVGSDLKSVQVFIIFTSTFPCLGRERAGLHTSQDWCARK